jgi:hypothetical protein
VASLDHRLQAGIPTGCEGSEGLWEMGGMERGGEGREVRSEMDLLGEGLARGCEWEALGGGGACGWREMWDGARL